MASGFEEFTRAVGARRVSAPPSIAPFGRFAVLGGGADARLWAALCLAEGAEVTLFSAYGTELEALRASSGIALRGAGPVGSYHVDRDGPSVRLTAELDAAVRGAEVIFLTGPLHKQRTYAMVLADHLSDGQVLVLAPGRSLGAVETAWYLRMGGCRADVTIVERHGLPFWFREAGTGLELEHAAPMAAAVLPRGREDVLARLEPVLGPSEVCDSVLVSGFADLSGAVEIPALVLGGPGLAPGGIAVPMGGVPLPENSTFAALIGDDQHAVIEALAEERRACARAYGVRSLPETDAWIARFAGAGRGASPAQRDEGAPGARPVPDRAAAAQMLRDGVVGSLVPLASAAAVAGVPVPRTQALITLTETLLGADIAASGRRLETIGITSADVDGARRAFDALMEAR
jgi:hypothetical protein